VGRALYPPFLFSALLADSFGRSSGHPEPEHIPETAITPLADAGNSIARIRAKSKDYGISS
jgi:hypothetical protein